MSDDFAPARSGSSAGLDDPERLIREASMTFHDALVGPASAYRACSPAGL